MGPKAKSANTKNGEDYRDQLRALGAVLAYPANDKNEEYVVVRDLKKLPADGKVEDLSNINRIFWVDDTAESVKSLSQALGLKSVPAHIFAFFPVDFEERLAKKELYYRNLKEGDIDETRFEVVRRGNRLEAKVVGQSPKKPETPLAK
jgi:hypothetical protein